MGLAWRKRHDLEARTQSQSQARAEERSKFLTSSEWLDTLDAELPGQRFFSKHELKQRFDSRKYTDSVTKGIEACLSEENVDKNLSSTSLRQEMTFEIFRKHWRKIRSGSGSQMDCTMVWREIKSFIKGSVFALQINREERFLPQNRFLSLAEYLALRELPLFLEPQIEPPINLT